MTYKIISISYHKIPFIIIKAHNVLLNTSPAFKVLRSSIKFIKYLNTKMNVGTVE